MIARSVGKRQPESFVVVRPSDPVSMLTGFNLGGCGHVVASLRPPSESMIGNSAGALVTGLVVRLSARRVVAAP